MASLVQVCNEREQVEQGKIQNVQRKKAALRSVNRLEKSLTLSGIKRAVTSDQAKLPICEKELKKSEKE